MFFSFYRAEIGIGIDYLRFAADAAGRPIIFTEDPLDIFRHILLQIRGYLFDRSVDLLSGRKAVIPVIDVIDGMTFTLRNTKFISCLDPDR